MSETSTGRAAGAWRISAKLQSDIDPSIRHSKDTLPEIIQVWTLIRVEYAEPVPSRISIEVIETPGAEDTGTFVLTGDSEFSVEVTRAMLRQLSAIFADIFGLHSVEYFVAGQCAQTNRPSSV